MPLTVGSALCLADSPVIAKRNRYGSFIAVAEDRI
jgi:hypothetical protein